MDTKLVDEHEEKNKFKHKSKLDKFIIAGISGIGSSLITAIFSSSFYNKITISVNGERIKVNQNQYQDFYYDLHVEYDNLTLEKEDLLKQIDNLKGLIKDNEENELLEKRKLKNEITKLTADNNNLQANLDSYTKEIEQLNEKIIKLESALLLVDVENLKSKEPEPPNELSGSVPLQDLQIFTQEGGNLFKGFDKFKTNMGVEYLYGMVLGNCSNYYTGNQVYFVNNKFKEFRATIAASEKNLGKSSRELGAVNIFCDDKKVFSTDKIMSDIIDPINIIIKLDGVQKLKIEAQIYSSSSDQYFGILNPKLLK